MRPSIMLYCRQLINYSYNYSNIDWKRKQKLKCDNRYNIVIIFFRTQLYIIHIYNVHNIDLLKKKKLILLRQLK